MKNSKFRIICNKSRTIFKIQEKTYSIKNHLINFLLTIMLGKDQFNEKYEWKELYYEFYNLEDAKNKIDKFLELQRDMDKSTWSVVEDEEDDDS